MESDFYVRFHPEGVEQGSMKDVVIDNMKSQYSDQIIIVCSPNDKKISVEILMTSDSKLLHKDIHYKDVDINFTPRHVASYVRSKLNDSGIIREYPSALQLIDYTRHGGGNNDPGYHCDNSSSNCSSSDSSKSSSSDSSKSSSSSDSCEKCKCLNKDELKCQFKELARDVLLEDSAAFLKPLITQLIYEYMDDRLCKVEKGYSSCNLKYEKQLAVISSQLLRVAQALHLKIE